MEVASLNTRVKVKLEIFRAKNIIIIRGKGISVLNMLYMILLLEFLVIFLSFLMVYLCLVICQLCSQQGQSDVTCVYRNIDSSESSENCQICDRSNHTAKSCFYRKKNRSHPSQMTVMQATFPRYMQPLYMPSMMNASNMPFMMHMVSPNMSFLTGTPNLNSSAHMASSQAYAPAYMNVSTSYASAMSNSVSPQVWLIYSGGTNHMTNDLTNLSLASPYPSNETVQTTNGEGLQVSHIGNSLIRPSSQSLKLNYVLYIPKLSHNLLSVHRICLDNNCWLIFDAYCFWIQDKNHMENLV